MTKIKHIMKTLADYLKNNWIGLTGNLILAIVIFLETHHLLLAILVLVHRIVMDTQSDINKRIIKYMKDNNEVLEEHRNQILINTKKLEGIEHVDEENDGEKFSGKSAIEEDLIGVTKETFTEVLQVDTHCKCDSICESLSNCKHSRSR